MEHLQFMTAIKGMKTESSSFQNILITSDLFEDKNKRVKQLSGG